MKLFSTDSRTPHQELNIVDIKNISQHIFAYLKSEPRSTISQERYDPLLIIMWNTVGLQERALELGAAAVASQAQNGQAAIHEDALVSITRMNQHYGMANRPPLTKHLIRDVLTGTCGRIKEDNEEGLIIQYHTMPQMDSAMEFLIHLIPVLCTPETSSYTQPIGLAHRAYLWKAGRNVEIETARLRDFGRR